MKTRFTYRSDKFEIPSPNQLFELTRLIISLFKNNPLDAFTLLQKHIVPMGQLHNGLFISFKSDPIALIIELEKIIGPHDEAKLEMSWPIPGMVRVDWTNQKPTIPFRVTSEEPVL